MTIPSGLSFLTNEVGEIPSYFTMDQEFIVCDIQKSPHAPVFLFKKYFLGRGQSNEKENKGSAFVKLNILGIKLVFSDIL